MNERLRIGIIIGSVREGRRGEGIARWFAGLAGARADVEPVVLDLKEFPLPDYQERTGARMAEAGYTREVQQRWVAAVSPLDGYVLVAPEYNHGYTAPLKNALDHVFAGWRGKPMAFVSYGGIAGGARSVQQLRQVAIELQCAPLRDEVNIPLVYETLDASGAPRDPYYTARAGALLDALVWWARALGEAREKAPMPVVKQAVMPRRAG